eukprot:CAMPEP_0119304240 /NCGR_PEP_ID=MMETSP1333-20130426/5513_1 /TAXON_ID=418940 /ORGANISM="Scyphosphaera apsteinii, Strain RCC1455" /LENGTH=340 /DNA_ID=CAMNT_0007307091 /DNA_START=15 /DNA_END=1037 /DNA_ORIENTATION=+
MPEQAAAGQRWADDDPGADDEMPELPPRYESEVDVNGVKTITTYRTADDGSKIKTVQTVKVTKKTIKIHKSVLARRQWAKFGIEKGKPAGYHGRGYTDGWVSLDVHEQVLDMTPKARAVEENNESAQRAFEKMNIGTFEAWRPKTRGDASIAAAKEWAEANGLSRDDPESGGGGGSTPLAALASGVSGRGSYVPPSMRNADGSRNTEMAAQRDDSCTVRVSNLSEDVKDSDLRELFRRFGAIQRIYLAKDKETHQSRGFAFINFFQKEDAAKAIATLDGHGYDHLILSVSWANPSSGGGGSGAGPTGGSGYQGSGDARNLTADSRFDKYVYNPQIDRFRS